MGTGPVVQGPGVDWQRPASWFFSTPRFLAAQRSAVSSRREEIAFVALAAQHNTRVCGPLCDPRGASFILPHRSSVFYGFRKHSLSGLQLQSGMQYVQRPDCRAANLQSFAAARHFCSAKILAGGLRWGWGPRRSREMHRPRKEISRGNLLCAKSGLPDLSYPRRLSAQKYVTTPDWKNFCTGQPPGARGTAVPLFREESRGTPSKGFLWATSSRRLDTALLFADKKRGVETTRLAGYCQLKLAPAATDGSKKPLAAALGSKNKKRRAAFAAPKPYSYRGTMIFTAR